MAEEWHEIDIGVDEVIESIVLKLDDFVSQNISFIDDASFKERIYEEIKKLRDMYGDGYNAELFKEIREILTRYKPDRHPNRILIEEVLKDIENKGL